MSTCSRCGVGAWHPEARMCLATDCELRAPQVLPVATDTPKDSGRPLAGGSAPRTAGAFVQASHGYVRPAEMMGFPVHAEDNAHVIR